MNRIYGRIFLLMAALLVCFMAAPAARAQSTTGTPATGTAIDADCQKYFDAAQNNQTGQAQQIITRGVQPVYAAAPLTFMTASQCLSALESAFKNLGMYSDPFSIVNIGALLDSYLSSIIGNLCSAAMSTVGNLSSLGGSLPAAVSGLLGLCIPLPPSIAFPGFGLSLPGGICAGVNLLQPAIGSGLPTVPLPGTGASSYPASQPGFLWCDNGGQCKLGPAPGYSR